MIWPLGRLPQRSTALERIDSADVTDVELSALLDFHDTFSRWTFGRGVVLGFLGDASRRWTGPITILDMACGRGDLSRSVARWAKAAGADVRIHGVDRSAGVIQMAREHNRAFREITFETRDLNDPFFLQAQQFDYVVSERGLHREGDDRTALFLKIANRMAKRGLVVTDWIRDARPAFIAETVARFWKNDAVTHDARVSIERGFRYREAQALRKAAGLDFARLSRHVGYRFSVAGERGLAIDRAFAPVTGLAGA